MKRLLYIFACALACVYAQAQTTLAFPEAEGFGKYTTGGRGGNVYYVTSLADCADDNLVPGTLRWALRDGDDTPRTVLFKVCGTIYLTSKLKLQHPNVTIAGQTAPGGGICIAGANIYVCKPNVIIRHIRFRAGDVPNTNYPCLDVENTRNVIIDHCSMTWSMEECLTMYDCDSTTVQWTIIGEGLYHSKHDKGNRSYATQWGGEHSTMHHCLITNCHNRTPRFNGVRDEADLQNGHHNHDAMVDSEFANNVIYNWGKQNSLYGGECDSTKNRVDGVPMGYNHVYMENNYFRPGPTTTNLLTEAKYRFVKGDSKSGFGSWLLRGNLFEANVPQNEDNYAGWLTDAPIMTEKTDSSYVVVETASEAFASVCQNAGALLPRIDEEDGRLLAEAAGAIAPQFHGSIQSKWLGIIDSQDDITFAQQDYFLVGDSVVGGYPFLDALPGDSLVLDTDGDGLPDLYETANALNPNDAADGAAITATGYSNLEIYLNGVASGTIDKTLYETLPYVSQEPEAPEPNAVEQVAVSNADKAAFVKYNGVLIIRKNDQKYTLSGQKVD